MLRPVKEIYTNLLPSMITRGTQLGAISGCLYGGFRAGKRGENFTDTFASVLLHGIFGGIAGLTTPLLIPPVTAGAYYIGKHYSQDKAI
jgi:hypothetical protein